MSAPFLQRFPGIASILRNGAALAGTQWVEAILRGVYVLAISRWLGPELYGVWGYATTSYAFALGFTLFGLDTLVPLHLGRDRSASAFLGTTFLLRFALLILAAAVFVTQAGLFEDDAQTRIALFLVIPALIGRGLVLWSRSALLGLDRSRTAFTLAVRLRLVEVVAGLLSLWLGAGLHVLLVIHAVSWLVEAGLAFAALSKRIHIPLRVDLAALRSVVGEGGVLALSTILNTFLAAMPLILTRHQTDDLAVVGQVGVATQLAALVVMGAQGVLGAAMPVVGRATHRGDPRLRHYTALVALGTAIVFAVAILLARAFGPEGVPAILGAGFAPAGTLLAPALLAGGLMVLPTGAWQVLVARGRRWGGVVAGAAGALALVTALPPLVETSGAAGAFTAAALGWGTRAAVIIGLALLSERTAID